jgi:hypothetical protein
MDNRNRRNAHAAIAARHRSGANGGVAADGTYIYWANATSGTIGPANLDGTGINQSFITGADLPADMAISLVPEPSTALLLSVGVVGLAVRRRHARSAPRGERGSA